MSEESNLVPATLEQAQSMGLLEEEFEKIKEILGRTPNFTELSVFGVMWSEHCSYKNSIFWLKTLPKDGDHMLVKAGEENAGLVDIGDGLACAFKIESHNHPSALEPYQGAATGVGGINRDIFTMGARPIAQLNSLRFGNIHLERTKWLVRGVSKGIGDYGNAFGIPIVGGEVAFNDCYNTNPLVNAFSAGIMKTTDMISATSSGVGNPVFIVGSLTGKDGIHGASFASKDISEDSIQDLPAVQVGDPFQEKLLLEATLELAKTDVIVGMQDMGAAGITCSSCEMSAAGNHGMILHLDKVPTRQENMKAWEILLSESQERMLVVVVKGEEDIAKNIFDKWDLSCEQIGEVTEGNRIQYYMHNKLVANVPAEALVLGGGAPIYEREYREPEYYQESKKFSIDSIKHPNDLIKVAKFLASHPNIASKKWIYEQYDSMVGTINMGTNDPCDAGIINLKQTDKALAVTVDCNARIVHADPQEGTAMAVAEAARNIVCSGGIPCAITNCLNFGNPYNPEVYWQFVGAIKGMSKACRKFNTPVTGGNVSFYNQSVKNDVEIPIFPTPTIGMLGIIDNKQHVTSLGFKGKSDLIYLIGECLNDISSSEYLVSYHKVESSPAPAFDLDKEHIMQETVTRLIRGGCIQSAHDISDGGLFITLLESAFGKSVGFDISTFSDIREDAFLFGESPSRVVVSVLETDEDSFLDVMKDANTPFVLIGHVTKGEIRVDDISFGFIEEYKEIYENSLSDHLK
ncbi:MAG: phosphoribosylformylglycinamidine synthase subunit PurL [Bacteroidota bacterium]|nr:phosphoribosylformylglycinamidine synthase subunit PurL [Bacteroidota bacterium]